MTQEIIRVSGDKVCLGDELQDVWFMQGGPAVVKHLFPYQGMLVSHIGQGSQNASFVGTSVQMTLCAKSSYRVSREVAQPAPKPARGLRRHEKDESRKLQAIVEQMNALHSEMGGRDKRPERIALSKCMKILDDAIKQGRAAR
jgi:hypothetical protein